MSEAALLKKLLPQNIQDILISMDKEPEAWTNVDTNETEVKKSQADVLVELAQSAVLFHDDLQEPFALIEKMDTMKFGLAVVKFLNGGKGSNIITKLRNPPAMMQLPKP